MEIFWLVTSQWNASRDLQANFLKLLPRMDIAVSRVAHHNTWANGWRRRYRVRAFGRVGPDALAGLARGLSVEGIAYGPIEASIERRTQSHVWLRLSLTEGKNREIRRVLGHLGLEVSRIIRTHFGPFALGRLKPGEAAEVRGQALTNLLADHAHRRG